MNVRPEVVTHPKFIELKASLGDVAMEVLVRVWGHCQISQRGATWKGVSPSYVEIVACGRPDNGRTYKALLGTGWIHQEQDAVIIHDWNEENAGLVSRWKRPFIRSGNADPSAQTPVQAPVHPSAQTPVQAPVHPSAQTPAPILSNQVKSYPVPLGPSKATGKERERSGADDSKGQKRAPGPAAAELAASKLQAGLLIESIREFEGRPHLSREERGELIKKKRALADLKARQINGDFRPIEQAEPNRDTQ